MGGIGGLAKQAPTEAHGGPDAFKGVSEQFLGDQPDLGAGGTKVTLNVVAIGQYLTGGRLDNATDNADQRGFTRTVGAQQGENLAPANFQIYIFEGLKTGRIRLVQVFHRKDRLHITSCYRDQYLGGAA